ncbi:MAG: SMP-30/gluconolactonase/LRE family protein, partial [Ferruginibacter sp.]
MLLYKRLSLACLVSLCILLVSCGQKKQPAIGAVEENDPSLRSIISKDASIEIIAEGFEWSEGPLWIEQDKMLLFSDVPKNIIYKWTAEKG